jgi:hypothetical protein
MAGIMGRRKRRAAVALHVPELTHAVKRVAGSNRRPCPPFTVGNRPIPIRQRYMRQPRAISMVRCGVFSAYKARSQQHTFQSRSATIKIGTFCHPALVSTRSHRTQACEAVQFPVVSFRGFAILPGWKSGSRPGAGAGGRASSPDAVERTTP